MQTPIIMVKWLMQRAICNHGDAQTRFMFVAAQHQRGLTEIFLGGISQRFGFRRTRLGVLCNCCGTCSNGDSCCVRKSGNGKNI